MFFYGTEIGRRYYGFAIFIREPLGKIYIDRDLSDHTGLGISLCFHDNIDIIGWNASFLTEREHIISSACPDRGKEKVLIVNPL